jgi:hypothetical protein
MALSLRALREEKIERAGKNWVCGKNSTEIWASVFPVGCSCHFSGAFGAGAAHYDLRMGTITNLPFANLRFVFFFCATS